MAPSPALPKTTTYPQNQVPFPSSEPQRRQPTKLVRPAMSKHSRSTSFFSAFRGNKQHSSDSINPQRTASLDDTSRASLSLGGSAPALATGSTNNPPQQTQHHDQSNQLGRAPLPTSTIMSQQQSVASGYQQPLPPTPSESQQQPADTGSANNASQPTQPPPSSSAGTLSQQLNQPPQVQAAPLHPEIRSVVGLTVSHAHKIYFSGPLVRRIERQADGQRPHKEEGWTEVWAQLGGTTLSLWDMKEVQEASRQGKEVPPTYVNVTDAFIQVLGSVTVPATATSAPKRYTNVLTLNTAGSNLLLFSCPSTPALISWASALRLSAWEKSRLEEIYTAHLIRVTLSNRDYATTLVRGRLEGWAQIRVAGQTDWKRVWMVICESSGLSQTESNGPGSSPAQQPQVHSMSGKKKRLSLFGRDHSPPRSNLPAKASIFMYAGQKPKERKKSLLTITDISQAFAVYPERPELISRSTLIKVEGTFGDEEVAMSMKSREGWILIMPLMEHIGPNDNHSAEMLKWVVGIHDAFGLYGRPHSWTWDPRDPVSLMFGYPVGPQKEHLFLDREVVENMDPRDDRTSVIRSRLREMLIDFIKSPNGQLRNGQEAGAGGPPSLPPIPRDDNNSPSNQAPNGAAQQFHPNRFPSQINGNENSNIGGPQLPPLSFGERPPEISRPLTPITERDSINTHTNAAPGDNQQQSPPQAQKQFSQSHGQDQTPSLHLGLNDSNTMLGKEISHSPLAMSPKSITSIPSVLANAVGTQQAIGAAAGSASRASFGDKALPPLTGRASIDSNGTNRSSFSGPPPPVKINAAPLSPNRRGGSVSSIPIPLSPRSSTFSANERQPEHPSSPSMASQEIAPSVQLQNIRSALPPPPQSYVLPPPAPVAQSSSSTGDRNDDFLKEAGALYFMQQTESVSDTQPPAKQEPVNFDDDNEDDNDSAVDVDFPKAAQKQPAKAISSIASDSTSLRSNSTSSRHPPVRQSTPMAFFDDSSSKANGLTLPTTKAGNDFTATPSPVLVASHPYSESSGPRVPADRGYASGRAPLGRKPSGARAPQPIGKGVSGQVAGIGYPASSHTQQLSSQYEESEEEEEADSVYSQRKPDTVPPQQQRETPVPANKATLPMASPVANTIQLQKPPTDTSAAFDDDSEALAALAYLDVSEASPSQRDIPASESSKATDGPPLVVVQPLALRPEAPTGAPPSPEVKSSFAPSRQAEERKKKAQAQQAALQAAVTKPGRVNGRKKKATGASWAESSDEDEEEDEEEDEDEDVDSDGEPSQAVAPPRMQQQQPNPAIHTQQQQQQHQQQFAPQSSVYPSVGGEQSYSQLRPPRTLPQPPGSRSMLGPDEYNGQQIRRQPSDQYLDNGRRTFYDDAPQNRAKPEGPAPGAARQTVWSQVLESNRPGSNFQNPNEPAQSGRDTFVQLEPSETMTKAFTPQGLLSAGMQDKEGRSAKRQEELARETGASLINVPNKPPPPQTGLLGAITAHERERKREGGVGAALTEREREKRVAEERQRRFDEQQRQQMDQMQQGGSMYGTPYGFNPMMNPMMMGMNPMMGMSPMMTGGGGMMGGQPALNPMMTGGGMNPMMTGGGMNPMMGYGMMPGFNPQHLFAAQQAAQAYQNAMIAFSVAGSQVGGGDGANGVGAQGMNAQQGMPPNMMGQGNMAGYDPRMSMNLMGMGMMGGMGQMGNPQMMGQAPLGPQMTGMSQFDPRFGVPGMNGSPGESGPLLSPSPPNVSGPNSQFASGNNSPVGRNSSPLRHSETPQRSRPTSPKI